MQYTSRLILFLVARVQIFALILDKNFFWLKIQLWIQGESQQVVSLTAGYKLMHKRWAETAWKKYTYTLGAKKN
jgi:hypothetical protein